MVLRDPRVAGSVAEGGQDSLPRPRQRRQDHPPSHVERRGSFPFRVNLKCPPAVCDNVPVWVCGFPEIGAAPADAAPDVGGAEHWDDQVQGF